MHSVTYNLILLINYKKEILKEMRTTTYYPIKTKYKISKSALQLLIQIFHTENIVDFLLS